MRRSRMALSTAVATVALSASGLLYAQFAAPPPQSGRPQLPAQPAATPFAAATGGERPVAPAPAPVPGDAPIDPMAASRGARYLLRNGLDYIEYGEYERALSYLREAEARQFELSYSERTTLQDGIQRAQKGLRGVADPAYASTSTSRRAPVRRRPGTIALESPPTLPNFEAPPLGDSTVQLTGATQVEPASSASPAPLPVDTTGPGFGPDELPADMADPASMPADPAILTEDIDPLPTDGATLPSDPSILPSEPIDAPAQVREAPATDDNGLPPLPTLPEAPGGAATVVEPPSAPEPLIREVPPSTLATDVPAEEIEPLTGSQEIEPLTGSAPIEPAAGAVEAVAEPEPQPQPETLPALGETSASPNDRLPALGEETTLPMLPPPTSASAVEPAPAEILPDTAAAPLAETEPEPVPAEPASDETLLTLPGQEPAASPEPVVNPEPASPLILDEPAPASEPEPEADPAVLIEEIHRTAQAEVESDDEATAPPAIEAELVPNPTTLDPLSTPPTPTPTPTPNRNPGRALPPLPGGDWGAQAGRETSIGSASDSDSYLVPDSMRHESLLPEDIERDVEMVARRQEEESRRNPPPQIGAIYGGTGPEDTTSRLDLPRAPSPTEPRPIRAIPIPEEFVPLPPRVWTPSQKVWAAAATCHGPLYFQDAVLERYGQSVEQAFGPTGRLMSYPLDDPKQSKQRNQIVQPFYSIGLFAAQIALLPYNLVVDPPWEAEWDLGYYRPGDLIPPDTYYLPWHGVGPPLHGRRY